MNMAEKINSLRTDLGLTLDEVGKAVGVGKSTVRKWETGDIANMKRDKIAKLAAALHTTPSYLMGWDSEENPATISDDGRSSLDDAIFQMWKALGPEEKKRAEDYMKLLIDAHKD